VSAELFKLSIKAAFLLRALVFAQQLSITIFYFIFNKKTDNRTLDQRNITGIKPIFYIMTRSEKNNTRRVTRGNLREKQLSYFF
jgi:hypothetical protein